ncbi:TBC1 domain family member 1-like, partial [Centroberyx affinis]|uniref:TBC1 domain family member 1-like n=1 Tax=Centroberyx affinis TaxID=166261 RepID=UPI003A5C5E87
MEGLYFEVKPKRDDALRPRPGSFEKPLPKLTSNRRSCPSLSPATSPTATSTKPRPDKADTPAGGDMEEEEEEVRYRLTLIGSLPVHHLTTMAMLPWVVAEIGRPQPGEREPGAGGRSGGPSEPTARNQPVFLSVSASRVQCVCVFSEGLAWDPLSHMVLFECRPHRVTKLIHNSQEPSSFGCLVRETQHCACYVFQCQDSTK